MDRHLFILSAALLLDRLIGEPRWLWSRLPHPVVLTGRWITLLDRGLNRGSSFALRRAAGIAALIILAAVSAAVGLVLARACRSVPLGWIAELAAVSILLAQKSLVDHVRAVASALAAGGMPAGRYAVSRIVGRDVTVLDEAGVSRAAIESLAENFSDGLVGPALWYAVLGLPGLLVYKAVSTADSMIGHRSPRHAAFGWAAARFDDLLNLVPARLSALAIVLAAAAHGDPRQAAAVAWRDARHHRSPNAGWPEAAAAGALGIALGGPRRYGNAEVDGAWLNADRRSIARPSDIAGAMRLIEYAWVLVVVATTLAGIATELW